jgi:hypothetical protein
MTIILTFIYLISNRSLIVYKYDYQAAIGSLGIMRSLGWIIANIQVNETILQEPPFICRTFNSIPEKYL